MSFHAFGQGLDAPVIGEKVDAVAECDQSGAEVDDIGFGTALGRIDALIG